MTVASVGLYILETMDIGAADCQASAILERSGSPQKNVCLSDGNAPGFSKPIWAIRSALDGTESQAVILCSCMNLAGALDCLAGMMCNDALLRN
jgi:hypothetical protein